MNCSLKIKNITQREKTSTSLSLSDFRVLCLPSLLAMGQWHSMLSKFNSCSINTIHRIASTTKNPNNMCSNFLIREDWPAGPVCSYSESEEVKETPPSICSTIFLG
ncbi:hypothetical protein Dimus_023857 [Dionaea muscipula]